MSKKRDGNYIFPARFLLIFGFEATTSCALSALFRLMTTIRNQNYTLNMLWRYKNADAWT